MSGPRPSPGDLKKLDLFPFSNETVDFNWFVLMHLFSSSFSDLVLDFYMYFHNVYFNFFCYLPLTKPDPRRIYRCSYIDFGYPMTEVSSF